MASIAIEILYIPQTKEVDWLYACLQFSWKDRLLLGGRDVHWPGNRHFFLQMQILFAFLTCKREKNKTHSGRPHWFAGKCGPKWQFVATVIRPWSTLVPVWSSTAIHTTPIYITMAFSVILIHQMWHEGMTIHDIWPAQCIHCKQAFRDSHGPGQLGSNSAGFQLCNQA